MTPATLAIFALMYQPPGHAPARYVEPHNIYSTEAECDKRRGFFVAYAAVAGVFQCARIDLKVRLQ